VIGQKAAPASAEPELTPRHRRLRETDGAAWEAYGAACRGGASEATRRRLFDKARGTMVQLRDFERGLNGAR
jgi:hypothetical protein